MKRWEFLECREARLTARCSGGVGGQPFGIGKANLFPNHTERCSSCSAAALRKATVIDPHPSRRCRTMQDGRPLFAPIPSGSLNEHVRMFAVRFFSSFSFFFFFFCRFNRFRFVLAAACFGTGCMPRAPFLSPF